MTDNNTIDEKTAAPEQGAEDKKGKTLTRNSDRPPEYRNRVYTFRLWGIGNRYGKQLKPFSSVLR